MLACRKGDRSLQKGEFVHKLLPSRSSRGSSSLSSQSQLQAGACRTVPLDQKGPGSSQTHPGKKVPDKCSSKR